MDFVWKDSYFLLLCGTLFDFFLFWINSIKIKCTAVSYLWPIWVDGRTFTHKANKTWSLLLYVLWASFMRLLRNKLIWIITKRTFKVSMPDSLLLRIRLIRSMMQTQRVHAPTSWFPRLATRPTCTPTAWASINSTRPTTANRRITDPTLKDSIFCRDPVGSWVPLSEGAPDSFTIPTSSSPVLTWSPEINGCTSTMGIGTKTQLWLFDAFNERGKF